MYTARLIGEPLLIVSFLLLSVQYYLMWTRRLLDNLRFWLMVATVLVMAGAPFISDRSMAPVFVLFSVLWLVLSVYLHKHQPPSRRPVKPTKRKR